MKLLFAILMQNLAIHHPGYDCSSCSFRRRGRLIWRGRDDVMQIASWVASETIQLKLAKSGESVIKIVAGKCNLFHTFWGRDSRRFAIGMQIACGWRGALLHKEMMGWEINKLAIQSSCKNIFCEPIIGSINQCEILSLKQDLWLTRIIYLLPLGNSNFAALNQCFHPTRYYYVSTKGARLICLAQRRKKLKTKS